MRLDDGRKPRGRRVRASAVPTPVEIVNPLFLVLRRCDGVAPKARQRQEYGTLCNVVPRHTLSVFIWVVCRGTDGLGGREGKLEMRRAWAVSLCVWSRIYPVKMAGVRRLNVSGIVDAVPSCCYDWW